MHLKGKSTVYHPYTARLGPVFLKYKIMQKCDSKQIEERNHSIKALLLYKHYWEYWEIF